MHIIRKDGIKMADELVYVYIQRQPTCVLCVIRLEGSTYVYVTWQFITYCTAVTKREFYRTGFISVHTTIRPTLTSVWRYVCVEHRSMNVALTIRVQCEAAEWNVAV